MFVDYTEFTFCSLTVWSYVADINENKTNARLFKWVQCIKETV